MELARAAPLNHLDGFHRSGGSATLAVDAKTSPVAGQVCRRPDMVGGHAGANIRRGTFREQATGRATCQAIRGGPRPHMILDCNQPSAEGIGGMSE